MPSAEWIESNLEPGGDVANRLASAAAAAPQGMPEGEAGAGQEGGPWLLPLLASTPPPALLDAADPPNGWPSTVQSLRPQPVELLQHRTFSVILTRPVHLLLQVCQAEAPNRMLL